MNPEQFSEAVSRGLKQWKLQEIFSITNLFNYPEKLLEVVGLVFSPLVIVELFKLLKINGTKNEQ